MTRTTIINDMKGKFGHAGFLAKSEIRRYLGVGKNFDIGWLIEGLEPFKIGSTVKYSTVDIAERLKEER